MPPNVRPEVTPPRRLALFVSHEAFRKLNIVFDIEGSGDLFRGSPTTCTIQRVIDKPFDKPFERSGGVICIIPRPLWFDNEANRHIIGIEFGILYWNGLLTRSVVTPT